MFMRMSVTDRQIFYLFLFYNTSTKSLVVYFKIILIFVIKYIVEFIARQLTKYYCLIKLRQNSYIPVLFLYIIE